MNSKTIYFGPWINKKINKTIDKLAEKTIFVWQR